MFLYRWYQHSLAEEQARLCLEEVKAIFEEKEKKDEQKLDRAQEALSRTWENIKVLDRLFYLRQPRSPNAQALFELIRGKQNDEGDFPIGATYKLLMHDLRNDYVTIRDQKGNELKFDFTHEDASHLILTERGPYLLELEYLQDMVRRRRRYTNYETADEPMTGSDYAQIRRKAPPVAAAIRPYIDIPGSVHPLNPNLTAGSMSETTLQVLQVVADVAVSSSDNEPDDKKAVQLRIKMSMEADPGFRDFMKDFCEIKGDNDNNEVITVTFSRGLFRDDLIGFAYRYLMEHVGQLQQKELEEFKKIVAKTYAGRTHNFYDKLQIVVHYDPMHDTVDACMTMAAQLVASLVVEASRTRPTFTNPNVMAKANSAGFQIGSRSSLVKWTTRTPQNALTTQQTQSAVLKALAALLLASHVDKTNFKWWHLFFVAYNPEDEVFPWKRFLMTAALSCGIAPLTYFIKNTLLFAITAPLSLVKNYVLSPITHQLWDAVMLYNYTQETWKEHAVLIVLMPVILISVANSLAIRLLSALLAPYKEVFQSEDLLLGIMNASYWLAAMLLFATSLALLLSGPLAPAGVSLLAINAKFLALPIISQIVFVFSLPLTTLIAAFKFISPIVAVAVTKTLVTAGAITCCTQTLFNYPAKKETVAIQEQDRLREPRPHPDTDRRL